MDGWMDEYGKDGFSERKGDVFARPVLMKQVHLSLVEPILVVGGSEC